MVVMAKPHENPDILNLMDSQALISIVDVDIRGSSCDANFNSNLLCTT
jgi:hypothetical protein